MYTKTTGTTDGLDSITWTDGITTLTVHTSGLVLSIDTDTAHQGEGRARAIWEHATTEMDLLHVPTWGRTFEGEQFAQAMGGDTMDDEDAAAILDFDLSILDNA